MLDLSTRRSAANDTAVRASVGRGDPPQSVLPLLCECARSACTDLVYVSIGEFAALRASGGLLVAAGHGDLVGG